MDPITTEAEAPTDSSPQAQHDTLAAQLADPNWTPGAPAEKEPEPETPAVTTPETPAGETPQETDEDKDEEEHDDEPEVAESKDKGKRFRFTDPKDRQFAALRKEGIAPDEAARIAYGITKANEPAAEAPAPESDAITAWQEELAEVDAQLEEAGANEGLMNADILALIKKRGDLSADIKTETRFREREAQQTAAEKLKTTEANRVTHRDARATAAKRFPSILTTGALAKEADRLTTLYAGTALIEAADSPMQIAELAAANVARANASANGTNFAVEFAKLEAQAQAAPSAQVATSRKITPASGAASTQRPDQPASDEDKFKEASAITDPRQQQEALNRLLYGT